MSRIASSPLRLRGVVLPDGETRDCFVVDGRIVFAFVPGAVTLHEGGYLTPGLVDCHAHLTIASPVGGNAPPREQARASARRHLEAGVLAIREPGSPDDASIDFGPVDELPRIITAGRLLTRPGSYFRGIGTDVPEADLPTRAEAESRRSGGWAKVVGDWPRDGRMRPNYASPTLKEAARRVRAAGGRIAIHATCAETIEAAIEAGFDSIEHGWGIRPEHFPEMARRNIALVPTLAMTRALLPDLDNFLAGLGVAPTFVPEMAESGRRHLEMAGAAHRAGVRVLAGTDAGMIPHGLIREEIRLLGEAGLSNEAALAAGSWDARRFLGLPSLDDGAPADIVVYAADPRQNLAALDHPRLTLLGGRVIETIPA